MTNIKSILSAIIFTFLFFASKTQAQDFDFNANNTSGCFPLQVVFTNTTNSSVINNYRYEWEVTPNNFSTLVTNVQHTYVSPGTYTVTMKVFDTNNTLVTTIAKPNYITVFKDPDVTIKSDKTSGCIYDTPFELSVVSETSDSPIDSYTWVISDGTSYSGQTPPSHYFTVAGSHSIVLSVQDENGCTNRLRKEIKVTTFDDFPQTQFSSNVQKTCDASLPVVLTNSTVGSYTYEWDFGDGSPKSSSKNVNHTYNGFGNYYVQLTAIAASGCKQTSTQIISLLNLEPKIEISDAYKTLDATNKACIGTLQFNDASTPKPISTWSWNLLANNDSNDPTIESTKSSFTSNFTSGGNYKIKLTVYNGVCTRSIIQDFTVEDELQITNIPSNEFYCVVPAIVTYNPISNIPNTIFTWRLEGKDTTGNPIVYSYQEGIYSDTLYAVTPNQCRTQINKPNNIEVAVPSTQITPIGPKSGCKPLTTAFDKSFTYNTTRDTIAKIEWDFGDGTPIIEGEAPKTHIYQNYGVYTAKITITTVKGCKAIDQTYDNALEWHKIKVGEIPSGTISYPSETCASKELPVTFIPSDPAKMKTLYDTLLISFIPLSPNSYPIPSDMKTAPPNVFKTFIDDSSGNHSVLYTLSDHGCSKIFPPSPDLVYVQGPLIKNLEGSAHNCNDPYNYTYKIDKVIDGDSWDWTIKKISGATLFGEKIFASNVNNVAINFNHDSLGRGRYEIRVRSYNNTTLCADSALWSTLVTDIKASFTLQDSTPCLGDTARFIFTGGQDMVEKYWHYTQDSIQTWDVYNDSLQYIFNSILIKNVQLIAEDANLCRDTTSRPVKVYQPHPDFSADIVSDCLPFTSKYTDATVSDTTIVSRKWTFGNTLEDIGNNIITTTEYSQKGIQSPSLEVVDILGCKAIKVKNNYIKPVVPNSQFRVATPKLCLNHDALFIRNTTDPNYDNVITRYSWDFGDISGDTGSLNDTVKHTYVFESMGKSYIPVSLTAYSMSPVGKECVSTTLDSLVVKDVASAIKIDRYDPCKQPGQKYIIYLNKTWYKSRYDSVRWWKTDNNVDILIGNKPNLQVVTYENYGKQKLWLRTVTQYYGCEVDTTSVEIDVPGYEIDFTIDKNQVCVKEEVTYTLTKAVNIDSYKHYWEFGDGTSDATNFPVTKHAYTTLANTTDNTYPVQFIVEAGGCTPPELNKKITVYPVLADFSRGITDSDVAGCAPYTITLYNNSVSSTSKNFEWDFGDGTKSTEANPTHTFATIDSVYNVTLSLESSICSDKKQKQITTHPLSVADIVVDTTICRGTASEIEATGNFTNIVWSPATYFLQSTSAKTTVNPPKSQYLYATLTSVNGCKSKDSIFVYVQQFPYYYGAPDSLLLFKFNKDSFKLAPKADAQIIAGQLYNVNNDAVPGVMYNWLPNTYLSCDDCTSPYIDLECGTPSHPSCIDFPPTIDYTITMADTLGCFENQETISFNIIIDTKAAMPKAFTPNNDGENDIAFVRGWGIKEFLEVKIYNRWGQVIFETNNLYTGWDGTYKGEPQANDTYAYTIKIINTTNEEEFIKGYITLLR